MASEVLMPSLRVAYIDTEATGLSPRSDRIIEIAIVLAEVDWETGAGQDSNLTMVGSTIRGGNDASLKADNAINLVSDQSISQQTGSSSGSSWAMGVTANASKNHGNSNGADLTNTNTQVIAGHKASLTSGGDTNLKGGVIASREKAVIDGKNTLTTGSFTRSKLQNKAD